MQQDPQDGNSANPFRENPYESPYAPVPQPSGDMGNDVGMRMLLPVGRSGWAIASGYLALFAPIMCISAPFALITGIMAVLEIRRNPKKHGLGRAWFGIIVGALGTLALLAFVVMMVIAALDS